MVFCMYTHWKYYFVGVDRALSLRVNLFIDKFRGTAGEGKPVRTGFVDVIPRAVLGHIAHARRSLCSAALAAGLVAGCQGARG